MDEQEKVDQIVGDLYAGTLANVAWERAMSGMTDLLGCSGVLLIAANPSTQAVTRYEVSPDEREIMELYRHDWAAADIRITRSLAAPVGEPRHEGQMLDKREWQRSAILNEFLLPLDVPFILATWLHKSIHKVVALTFEGSKGRGPFDENDARKLKCLIPHVQRALQIRDRLEAEQVRASTLSSVVDQAHIGVIMLDQKGRILEATGLAESLLSAESGIRCASDRTLWLREPAGSQLREWILSGLPPKDHLSAYLSVARSFGLKNLCLVVAPMPRVATLWTAADPRWLIVVFDPEQRVAPAAALISRDLGISARESEIAVLLSTGHALCDIAARLGISLHTAKAHLKHIFEKTGVHSQCDLVRRVLLCSGVQFGGRH
jgi:DNA-binding CsgD family transcriptional regulator/PAS domain-containing protein